VIEPERRRAEFRRLAEAFASLAMETTASGGLRLYRAWNGRNCGRQASRRAGHTFPHHRHRLQASGLSSSSPRRYPGERFARTPREPNFREPGSARRPSRPFAFALADRGIAQTVLAPDPGPGDKLGA
jgi:hypothetical protein